MLSRALIATTALAALPLTAAAQWASEDLSSDGVEIFCLASGDVDGDLLQDLVAGTQDSTILVYRHGEDGLAVAQGIQLADDPMALDVADLDGDGDLDIIYGPAARSAPAGSRTRATGPSGRPLGSSTLWTNPDGSPGSTRTATETETSSTSSTGATDPSWSS